MNEYIVTFDKGGEDFAIQDGPDSSSDYQCSGCTKQGIGDEITTQ